MGVRFVELASTTRPELAATALADQLGVRSSSTGESVVTTLEGFLRTKRLLLVLDNFEQVSQAAPLVTDLLTAAPGLKGLVTSRTVLNLRGEHDVVVPPLGGRVVSGHHRYSGGDPVGDDAVQLFATRASAVDPQFRLDERNVDAIAEICRRLDGLPLAIELAASRVRFLPPLVLLARLHDGLGLVGVGPSDAPDRQRTLHDTITWSYNLLTPEEQQVLTSLAVFSGGFDLDAVQALHRRPGGPGDRALRTDPLLTLGSLVDKSLVRAVVEDGRPRFGMLETIREYALARLHESGRWQQAKAAHARHYRDVAESAGRGLRQQEQRTWLRLLEVEPDNVRAALSWDLERADVESALRIGWGIWIFWWFGHIDDGARWFETISAMTGSITPYQQAQALTGAGLMGFARGDLDRAETALQQSLALYREVNDRPGVALASGALGHLATRGGNYDQASELLRVSLDLYRDLGDDWYAAIMLNFLGAVSQSRSDHDRAAEVFT
jgi:predicted ATPase